MKKKLSILFVVMLALSLIACGKKEKDVKYSDKKSKVVNNAIYKISEKEMAKKTGISFADIQGADKVAYNVLEASSKNPIAEMEFCMDGYEAYVRAVPTKLTKVPQDVKEDFRAYDISGLFYNWDLKEKAKINNHEAYIFINTTKKVGYIMWLDIAPGILYNLGIQKNVDSKLLIDFAQKVFKPMQGENK